MRTTVVGGTAAIVEVMVVAGIRRLGNREGSLTTVASEVRWSYPRHDQSEADPDCHCGPNPAKSHTVNNSETASPQGEWLEIKKWRALATD